MGVCVKIHEFWIQTADYSNVVKIIKGKVFQLTFFRRTVWQLVIVTL